eukprot:4913087-Ditylum_brightwellii.AAC.1
MGSQRMAEFSGMMEDWQERNDSMWCAFNGSGCGIILSEREYVDRRRNQNRKVFSNVSFASSRKMMYDLERQHEDIEDGYTARKSSNEWFNKDINRTKFAEAPRKEYQLLVGKRGKRKR